MAIGEFGPALFSPMAWSLSAWQSVLCLLTPKLQDDSSCYYDCLGEQLLLIPLISLSISRLSFKVAISPLKMNWTLDFWFILTLARFNFANLTRNLVFF